MRDKVKKEYLGYGRTLIVFFLLVNLLLPYATIFVIDFIPLLKAKTILSLSAEKFDLDQEDEKDISGEKEKEVDKDFFIQFDSICINVSWECKGSSKYFYERAYPAQIFPITTPPPKFT